MSDERCQRCGEVGQDRRTLWMACLYEMNELRLPFEMMQIKGIATKKIGENKDSFLYPVPVFADEPSDVLPHGRVFYTLRVCKDCRGDWMGAIASWFAEKPARESCGSGIFVRENGATVEITEEEWRRRSPDREPVRFVP